MTWRLVQDDEGSSFQQKQEIVGGDHAACRCKRHRLEMQSGTMSDSGLHLPEGVQVRDVDG